MGNKRYGWISHGFATGNVTGSENVGGFFGTHYGFTGTATIEESFATGTVTGTNYVGGFAGYISDASVSKVYAKGKVSGLSQVGGLVGTNATGTIDQSYSIGEVSGTTNIGGLVGESKWSGVVTNSFWNTETSSQSISAGGSGLTTNEIKNPSSFSTWDFSSTWSINEDVNNGYPYFNWQTFEPPVNITNKTTTIIVFPNQTSSHISIQRVELGAKISIRNNLGVLVIPQTEAHFISVEHLTNGMYFVEILDVHGTKSILQIYKQ